MTNPTEAKGGAKLPAEVLERMEMARRDCDRGGANGAMQAVWDAGPGNALIKALRRVEEHFPIFADPDSVPEDDAAEVTFSWGEVHEIRRALAPFSKAGQEQEERG